MGEARRRRLGLQPPMTEEQRRNLKRRLRLKSREEKEAARRKAMQMIRKAETRLKLERLFEKAGSAVGGDPPPSPSARVGAGHEVAGPSSETGGEDVTAESPLTDDKAAPGLVATDAGPGAVSVGETR